MLSSLLNFVRDNYQSVEAAALGAGALFAAAWLWSRYRNRPLVSRANPLQRRRASKDAADGKPQPSVNTHQAFGEMLRLQTLRDRMNKRKLRSAFEKRQAAIETLTGRESQADLVRAALPGELMNFSATLSSASDEPVAIHSKWLVAVLNFGLFAGDILIVSSALAVAEQVLDDNVKYLAAAALAISVWLGGKVIGDGIAQLAYSDDNESSLGRAKFLIGLLLLGGAATGLAMLRLLPASGTVEHEPTLILVVWLLLALAPGLGSTALTLLSSNRPYKALRAADQRWRAKSFAARRATRRSARASSQVARLDARVALLLTYAQLEAEAVGAFYGLNSSVDKLVRPSRDFEESLISLDDFRLRIARNSPQTERPDSAVGESRQRTQAIIDLVESEYMHPGSSSNGSQ